VLPREHILEIQDPNAIVDVLMGALVVSEGKQYSLDDYIGHMVERGQSPERCEETRKALARLRPIAAEVQAELELPDVSALPGRKGQTTRL
jgi:hypothetical protein